MSAKIRSRKCVDVLAIRRGDGSVPSPTSQATLFLVAPLRHPPQPGVQVRTLSQDLTFPSAGHEPAAPASSAGPVVFKLPEATEIFLRLRNDPARFEKLNDFRGKRIYRFALSAPGTDVAAALIVKTWDPRRGSWLRRLKRHAFGERSGCDNEFGMLRHLYQRAPLLGAPQPIANLGLIDVLGSTVEVALISDLGPCRPALQVMERSVAQGDHESVARIDSFVIASVRSLLFDAVVVDQDHSLINMVEATRTGALHRIDFEVAQHRAAVRRPDAAIGEMLGRMVATHVYGSQPRTEISIRFMAALRGQLPELSRAVWAKAAAEVRYALKYQRRRRGIETAVDLSPLLD
jgi:hypothetical protein